MIKRRLNKRGEGEKIYTFISKNEVIDCVMFVFMPALIHSISMRNYIYHTQSTE